jgi:hypothetical protein
VKIAFFKARHGSLIDWLIDLCTERRGFSHCELVFSDGVFFSSSGEDGGCRFKQIKPDPRHWEIYDFNLSIEAEERLRDECQLLVLNRVKYDWTGVLGFVIPMRAEPRRLFCSECLVYLLQKIGMFQRLKRSKVSPSDLWQIMEGALDLQRIKKWAGRMAAEVAH